MRVLLLSVAVLALAVVFGMSERAPGSTQPVSSDDVGLVSEQTLSEHDPKAGKNGNSDRNGRGRGGRRTDFGRG